MTGSFDHEKAFATALAQPGFLPAWAIGVMALAVLMPALLFTSTMAPIIFSKHIANQSLAASAGLLFIVGTLRLWQLAANNSQATGSGRN